MRTNLAEAAVQAHEAGASDPFRDPRGRDRCTGAEGRREARNLPIQDVAVRQCSAAVTPGPDQPDRSGKRPEAFLKGFEGAFVTDGYQGYNLVAKVTHCGCWAHARRKWREAMPDGATVKTSKAAVGFQYCNKLFAEERKCAAYKPKYR